VNAANEEFVAYIDGIDRLRLDRQANYSLSANLPIEHKDEVSMEIQEGADLATLRKDDDNVYVLHANAKNKLGKLILKATYNNIEYTKTVEIIPLW
jgi:hypothetical protein